jgi:CHAD domain-containing protein
MKKLWKNNLTLQQNVRKRLPKLARRYLEEGRDALAPGTAWKQMHKFRLHTKRFRYTLETFQELYGPGLLKRVDSLKKVQTYLGDINDCIVTSEMLKDMEGMDDVRAKLEKKADEKMDKLREFWADTFDAEGAESLWTRYLVIYACRPSRVNRSAPKYVNAK